MPTSEQLTALREKLIHVTNKVHNRPTMDVEVGELDDIADHLQEIISSLQ